MYKITTILITLTIFFTSCTNRQAEYKETDIYAVDSVNVFLGLPTGMEFYKNNLLITDLFDDKSNIMKVVDVSKKSLLFTVFTKGQGPNEFNTISSVNIFNNKEKQILSVYDLSTRKAREYYLDSLLNGIITPFNQCNSSFVEPIESLFKVDNGYIATGYFPDGKLAILDDSLKLVNYTGSYRAKSNEAETDFLHCQANSGPSCITDDRKNIIVATYFAGVIEMYSIENGNVKKTWENVLYDLDYIATGNGMFQNKNPMGFMSLDVTKNYIYALYSGEKEELDDIATYGGYVYKLDLNGKIIAKYKLDRKAFAIRIHNNKLYSLVHTPEPNILVYDID